MKAVRETFIEAVTKLGKETITTADIKNIMADTGIAHPYWFTNQKDLRIGRGVYDASEYVAKVVKLPKAKATITKTPTAEANVINSVVTSLEVESLVPEKHPNYVPFGIYKDVETVIKSKEFFPCFITGQSGNGKTMSVEQACARNKRKYVCVSMTPETDEGDLLGNYVLINGQMEWRDGPVTVAAKQGAVLCIDEIDYGANNLASLQRVLEGKPFLLKKKGEIVTPAEGFTIFATANTKGKGSDDGRYMYTNVLNEAFLERFPTTEEQDWPSRKIEINILKKELDGQDDDFAEKLVIWAEVIRKTFEQGGCDEVISTRRLVHISKTFGIFSDKLKSIAKCIARFDEDTKATFLDLYTKVDSGADADSLLTGEETPETPQPEELANISS